MLRCYKYYNLISIIRKLTYDMQVLSLELLIFKKKEVKFNKELTLKYNKIFKKFKWCEKI